MKPVDIADITSFIETNFTNGRQVASDEDLLRSGQIDSVGIMALVAFLEEAREAPIPPQDVTLENFKTINDISAYINNG